MYLMIVNGKNMSKKWMLCVKQNFTVRYYTVSWAFPCVIMPFSPRSPVVVFPAIAFVR